jgi:vesicle coat complex subunit
MPPPPGQGPRDESYFTESRKGEVNELRALLRTFGTEKDRNRKRDIMKKVIAYMTLGIDVSRLFTEMMLAIETRDLVIKKMVYLFLCNYAETHPDLAQMCTNTLVKDCGNEDPMVRGLALRALCSLRLPQMIEYTSEPLRKSLQDGHAYVRKTGVMGILKMYHLNQEEFDKAAFNDILYDMLRDPDSSVVTNCILVLNEIMADSGGMALNRAVMLHLLNRIHEFSEFGILSVLDLVPRYIPANDDEGFQIMNLLDPVLRTANAGAVVATIRAFLSIADAIGKRPGDDRDPDSPTVDDLKRQVVVRIKAPLVTLIASSSNELAYVLLKYADQLIDLCPGIFDDEYRQFYVRYSDPTHIQHSKVRILAKLANPQSAPDIVSELSELVASVDDSMGRIAVRSMASIALRDSGGEGAVESIAMRLVEMLDLQGIPHVSSEAAVSLANLVRRHPNIAGAISAPLPRALKYIAEPSGKAALIFLIGECGESITEAPYVLEKVIDSYDNITDHGVKTALLAATVTLFFKRPPEVQLMLGRLLKKATDDVSSQDLHDRALFYYRLLRSSPDPNLAKSIINSKSMAMSTDHFAEEDDFELRAALMNEFNTLCTIYRCRAENFIDEENLVKFVKMPPEHPLPREEAAAPVIDPGVNHIADQFGGAVITDASAAPVAAAPVSSGEVDLLGFGDDFSAPPPVAAVNTSSLQTLSLKSSVSLSGDGYQTKWGAVADSDATVVSAIPLRSAPSSTDVVESSLSAFNLFTMASGELPTEFKFFLYCQEESGGFFLIQAVVQKAPASLSLTVKTHGCQSDPDKINQVVELIKTSLGE